MAFDFEGLLGNPMFTGGLGLLAAGLDDRPLSEGITQGLQFAGVGQDFANARQERESQRLINEQRRMEMEQANRQRQARQQLTNSLLGQPIAENVGAAGTPLAPGFVDDSANVSQNIMGGMDVRQPGLLEGQSSSMPGILGDPNVLGAMAQADPMGTLSMIQEQQSPLDPTSQQRNLQAAIDAGLIDPSTSEGRDRMARFLLDEEDPNGQLLEQQRAAIEAQRALLEARDEQLNLQTKNLAVDESLDVGFRDLVDLSRLNESLEDTLAETGGLTQGVVTSLASLDNFTPRAVIGAVRSMTGTDISLEQAKKLANDLQTFRNKSTESLSHSLVKLAEHNVNPTDTKVGVLAQTVPSTGNFPRANDRIILDKLETLKRAAEFRGKWDRHPLRGDVEREIENIRDRLGLSGATRTSVKPSSPTSRRNIVELPGNSTLNFRSE